MKIKGVLILIGFLLLSGLLFSGGVLDELQNVQASDRSAEVIERASAQQAASLAPDNHSSNASVHFEPLFLLVMGTTLFFLGSAIKLALSRRLDPKNLGPARKPPSPQC